MTRTVPSARFTHPRPCTSRTIRSALRALPSLLAAVAFLAGAPALAQTWLWEIPHGLEPGFRAPGYVPGELLVKFHANSSASDRSRAARDQGDEVVSDVTPDGLVKVKLAPGQTVEAQVERYSQRSDVEYAAPNLYARGFFVPNDSLIAQFDFAWNLRAVDAYDAWDVVRGDPRIVLAIIDSGIAYEDHEVPPYERAHIWPGVTQYRQSAELPGPFLPGWDFVNDDAHPDDDNGHGTAVATIAAGAANNVAGSAGIAFGVTLLPIKVLDWEGDSDMEWVVKGIRFAADQGADVANLSLGFAPIGLLRAFGYPEKVIQSMFNPLRDAVNYAQSRGTILVAAAGNFGASEVSLPAAYPGVIAVGASTVDQSRVPYSSYGFDLDFLAPGGGFDDLNDDHVQDGLLIYGIKPDRSEGSLAKPDSFGVFVWFGTSGASPHVAGAVALLRSLGLKQEMQIEQTLRATAVDAFPGKPGTDFYNGAGVIQIGEAVRHPVSSGSLKSAAAFDGGALDARLESGNPSRGGATLRFRVPREGPVTARVYDIRGALVRTLSERVSQAGEQVIRWDGLGQGGAPAPNGVYFIRVETPEGTVTRKVAFLR